MTQKTIKKALFVMTCIISCAFAMKAADETSTVNLTFVYPWGGQFVYPVASGTSVDWTVTPSTGWQINALTVNGENQTTDLSAEGVYPSTEYSDDTTFIFTAVESSDASSVVSDGSVYITTNGKTISLYGSQKGQRLYMTNSADILLLNDAVSDLMDLNGVVTFNVNDAGVYYVYLGSTPSSTNLQDKVTMTGGKKFLAVFTEE